MEKQKEKDKLNQICNRSNRRSFTTSPQALGLGFPKLYQNSPANILNYTNTPLNSNNSHMKLFQTLLSTEKMLTNNNNIANTNNANTNGINSPLNINSNMHNLNVNLMNNSNQIDQLSDRSDEEINTKAINNFMTLIRDIRVRRKINVFLDKLPSRRFKKLNKKQFGLIQDKSSHFKLSRYLLLLNSIHDKSQQSFLPFNDNSPQFNASNHPQYQSFNQAQLPQRINNNTTDNAIMNNEKNIKYKIKLYDCMTLMKQRMINNIIHIKYRLTKILHRIPLFDYQSNKKIIWDVMYCICSLIFYFSVPLHVSFNKRIQTFVQLPLIVFSWFIILLHIFITLNTCYYEKGLLVNSRQKILHHYMQKSFFTDISSFLPLTIIVAREINPYPYTPDDPFQIILSLLFVFKIFQFQKVIMGIEERFHLSNRLNYLIQLCRVNIENKGKSWLQNRGIDEDIWQVQYLQGFYFVTVTMISVGYGDIIPASSSEIILCIIIMFISCGVFAYSLTMIEYYQRQFSEQNEKEEQKIIGHLSENLKNSLMIEANKVILKDSPIFSKYFSEGVIEKMVSIIKEYRCTPEQVIQQRNNMDKDDAKIYFIKSGLVEIYAQRGGNGVGGNKQQQQLDQMKKTGVIVLKEGDSFGEYQFFTGSSNSYSARSLEFSRILYINRKEFLEILKQFPLDYEKFCYIKDKIILQRDASAIQLKCYVCESEEHLVENCNMTHYICDEYKVMKKNQCQVSLQEREQFDRSHYKLHWHSRIEEVREHAWQLQDDNESYIENASWMSWDSESYIPSDEDKNNNNLGSQEDQNNNNFNSHHHNHHLNHSQKITSIRCEFDNNHENNNLPQLSLTSQQSQYKKSNNGKSQYNSNNNNNMDLNNSITNTSPPPESGGGIAANVGGGGVMKNQKITTPLMNQRHLFYMRQNQQAGMNKMDENNNNNFERKETIQSKKRNNNQYDSPRTNTTTPRHQNQKQMDYFQQNQNKLLRMTGNNEQYKGSETMRSQQSESLQNNSIKLNAKPSNFNNNNNNMMMGQSPQNMNKNASTPQRREGGFSFMITQQQQQQLIQSQQQLQLQNQQQQQQQNQQQLLSMSGSLTNQNYQSKKYNNINNNNQYNNNQQSNSNNNSNQKQSAINIAELIGNQLFMNNKNNYVGKQNEENTFDVKKIYEFYYKNNNYPNVLKKYNKPILRLIKILQKHRQLKRKNQSIIRDNSKIYSMIQSHHYFNNNSSHFNIMSCKNINNNNLNQSSGFYNNQNYPMYGSTSPKKSQFRQDLGLSHNDSIISSLNKQQHQQQQQQQQQSQLKMNTTSHNLLDIKSSNKITPFNMINLPFSPTISHMSANVSININNQSNNIQDSINNNNNQGILNKTQNYDETSIFLLSGNNHNNNTAKPIDDLDINTINNDNKNINNTVMTTTNVFETAYITTTQGNNNNNNNINQNNNDQLLTLNRRTLLIEQERQDTLTQQIEKYKKKLKTIKSNEISNKINIIHTQPIEINQKLNKNNNNNEQDEDSKQNDDLIENNHNNNGEIQCPPDLLGIDNNKNKINQQNEMENINNNLDDCFEQKRKVSNFSTIEEKTSENIHTCQIVKQESSSSQLSKPIINITPQKSKLNTEENNNNNNNSNNMSKSQINKNHLQLDMTKIIQHSQDELDLYIQNQNNNNNNNNNNNLNKIIIKLSEESKNEEKNEIKQQNIFDQQNQQKQPSFLRIELVQSIHSLDSHYETLNQQQQQQQSILKNSPQKQQNQGLYFVNRLSQKDYIINEKKRNTLENQQQQYNNNSRNTLSLQSQPYYQQSLTQSQSSQLQNQQYNQSNYSTKLTKSTTQFKKQPSIEIKIQENNNNNNNNRKRSTKQSINNNSISRQDEKQFFGKSTNNNTLFPNQNSPQLMNDAKKQSIRRYSRAYNMALSKRSSQKQNQNNNIINNYSQNQRDNDDYNHLNLIQKSQNLLTISKSYNQFSPRLSYNQIQSEQQQQKQKQIKKSEQTLSSSSSSSQSSSSSSLSPQQNKLSKLNPIQELYEDQSKLQINHNLRFDMD